MGEAGYIHESVNHSKGEWVRNECYINNCENRASFLWPWFLAHEGVSKNNVILT